MTEIGYDKSSVESIFQYALALTGKSLHEAIELPPTLKNAKGRGQLGNMVEEYYFGIKQNSDHRPDFPECGLELKTTGVLKKKGNEYKAKERLVLSVINYESLVNEMWKSSSLLEKIKLMLILFYLYDSDIPAQQRKFILEPLLFEIPNEDIDIIRRDWEFIQQKVKDGKAHELSEGDTFYLGACRKGSGGANEPLRTQPNSDLPAKARAFSFKNSYLSKIIAQHVLTTSQVGKAIPEADSQLGVSDTVTFEEATALRFRPYIGMPTSDISDALDFHKKNQNQKGFHRSLANRILSAGNGSVSELQKADIELKTIRLNKSGKPREAMSFPGFKFNEIIHQDWEDSNFFEKLEHKFLFVIFSTDEGGIERLQKVAYWNMPYLDRLEAQAVWEETRRRVNIDASNLPKATENRVAHVRPKGRNKADTLPTPQGTQVTKQCFWLNQSYIHAVIEGL